MKALQIEIKGLPHCPRNRSHAIIKKGKFAMLAKTEAARSYEAALKHHLQQFKIAAETFRSCFDEKKHCLTVIWEFASPEVVTKSGKISENSTDLDAHKVLQDVIFEFIGIDDAYIVRDTRSKCQGDYRVSLDLRIQNLNGSYEIV